MKLQCISIKGSGEWNEDAVITNEHQNLYGVIDGATSLVPFRGPDNETGGRMASQLVKGYFEDFDSSRQTSLESLLAEANLKLGGEMKRSGIDLEAKDQLWTAGAAVVRITDTHIEYVQTGDCMIIALYDDGTTRAVTRDHVAHIDEQSRVLWKQGIASGVKSKDTLWETVKPLILGNKQKMNTSRGYSVLNGLPEAEHYFECGKINRIRLQSLLLVTDGLFYPEELGGHDDGTCLEGKLVQEVMSLGLQQYAEWLLKLENDDPECIQYPRFKKSDDKSAIWIELV
ncbi:hypothetical protein A8L34_14020 [Bacillus sp. FJAT-27264]|uniref:PP2C family serine/threonine-protein phosphatase n=1 Tax=Paenibacillus sp. (strain DSM 101736 / FJAT-27264) TaxID=1850362 RepID=UPI000807D3C6|nr:PP2C family serine/threonine-protein phosphatase [Bacillus sp. FJAT-27264]OBZ14992.1 hypothetical protein A8L34_14020 [Bacillus sp. FJAT-27264]